MRRVLGFLLFVAGVLALYFDWIESGRAVETFRLRAIGEVIIQINSDALQLFEAGVSRYVSQGLWDTVFLNIIVLPAAPVLIGLGLLLLIWGSRSRARRRYR